MPVYSKLLSAVALVALVVSGGAVNTNLRSNVARSAPVMDVRTMRPVDVRGTRGDGGEADTVEGRGTRGESGEAPPRRIVDDEAPSRRPIVDEDEAAKVAAEEAAAGDADPVEDPKACKESCNTVFAKTQCSNNKKGKPCRKARKTAKKACKAAC